MSKQDHNTRTLSARDQGGFVAASVRGTPGVYPLEGRDTHDVAGDAVETPSSGTVRSRRANLRRGREL